MSAERGKYDIPDGDIRHALRDWLRPFYAKRTTRLRAAKDLGVALGTIDTAIYRGRGGIALWQKLIMYAFDIDDARWTDLLVEFRRSLQAQGSLSPGQRAWAEAAEVLSDDEKVFFAEAALALKAIRDKHDGAPQREREELSVHEALGAWETKD